MVLPSSKIHQQDSKWSSCLMRSFHKAEQRTLNTLIKLVTFARETALAKNPFAFFVFTSPAPLAVFRDAPYLPHLNAAVCTALSQCAFISSSRTQSVIDAPAISSDVVNAPTSTRPILSPRSPSHTRVELNNR
jgi:hypothetical protein